MAPSIPLPHDPDALLARWRATREVTALGALFDATAPTLFRIALATSRDPASAEDALQETFLAALRALERHDPTRPVVPFLVGILQNEVRMARRRAARVPDPARMVAGGVASGRDGALAADDAAGARAAMEALEEPYRSAALLRWRYGLEPAEIAHVRGEPPGTTRSIIARALERLRGAWKGLPAMWLSGGAGEGGLARVRAAVLEEMACVAQASAVAGTVGGALGGGLAMKKVLGATALLIAALGGGWALWPPASGPAAPAEQPAEPPPILGLEARGAKGKPAGPIAGASDEAEPIDAAEAARLAALPKRRASLAGRVLDTTGRPVPGAVVRAHGRVDAVVFARETRAGTDGAYRLDVAAAVPEIRGRDLGGVQWLAVTAAGFAPLDLEAPSLREGESAARDLVLARGATVEGLVVEADSGRPLAGVLVRFTSYVAPPSRVEAPTGEEIEGVFARRPGPSTTSDGAGRFTLRGLPCGGFHPLRGVGGQRGPIVGVVAAYVPGFAPAGDEVPAVSEGDVVDARIELWPAATVTGRVVDAQGDPMAGIQAWAWVESRQGHAYPGWTSPGVPSALARTGADGRFSIPAVRASRSEPTSVQVMIWRSLAFEGSGAPLAVDERTEAKGPVRAGETLDLGDVVLPRTDAPSAAVRVRDRSGAPVRGARVQIVAQHDRSAKPTDADGRTRLWWPTWSGATLAEMRAVTVEAAGFGREVVRVDPRRGETLDVDVVLGPAHRVAGRVLEEDGRPAAGRWILVANGRYALDRVLPADRPLDTMAWFRQAFDVDGPLYLGDTNTDEDGRFEVLGLPDGPYHVGTSGDGGRMISAAGVAADATDVALRVPVAPVVPTVSLEGTAVDAASGAPVLRPVATLVSDAGVVEAQVPTVGAFRFDGVRPGSYTIRVRGEGYVERSFASVRVGEAGTGPFRAELTRGAALVGRVTPPAGVSLRDRTITLRARLPDGRWGASIGARLRPDGSYRVVGLAPGRYCVWVHPPSVPRPESPVLVPVDAEDARIEAGAPEARLDLVVVAAGNLQVHWADERLPKAAEPGNPRDEVAEAYGAACRVTVMDARGRVVARVEGLRLGSWDDASYEMLPAGRYRVRYEAPGAAPTEVDAEVRAAGQTEVTVPERAR